MFSEFSVSLERGETTQRAVRIGCITAVLLDDEVLVYSLQSGSKDFSATFLGFVHPKKG